MDQESGVKGQKSKVLKSKLIHFNPDSERITQNPKLNSKGFTLIELIIIIILLGILAVVATYRFTSAGSYSLVSEAEILKNHIRFAQIKAMSDLDPNTWGINVSSTSYTLQNNGSTAATKFPGDNSATHAFRKISATPQTITFDSWGNPGSTDLAITLTSGTDTSVVTVKNNTGFIQ